MLYDIKVPIQGRIVDLLVETTRKYTLDELKERLYKENISEDLKDDISFAREMTVENLDMKSFFVNYGFKIFKIEEK